MITMTETTTGTDDQQSDEMIDDNDEKGESGQAPHGANNKFTEAVKEAPPVGGKPWPVEAMDQKASLCDRIRIWYGTLFYSYMNPIFQKGMNQFKSAEHLDQKDLFEVPSNMASEKLVERFWYVLFCG